MIFNGYYRDTPHHLRGLWVATGYIKQPKLYILVFLLDDPKDIAILLADTNIYGNSLESVHKSQIELIKGYLKAGRRYALYEYQPDYTIIIKEGSLSRIINLLTEQLHATMWEVRDEV